MTTGIQVYNDYGSILVDENYSNLAVRQKGSATISSYGYITTFKVPNCTSPMVAVQASNGLANASTWLDSDGTTLNVYIGGDPGTAVTWWVFDVPINPASYGLVIYKSDGSLAFDATKQYIRIVDVVSGSDFPTPPYTKSYPSGRSYGFVTLKAGYWRWIHSNPDSGAPDNGNTLGWVVTTQTKGTRAKFSGQTVTVDYWTESTSVPGPKGVNLNANNSPQWKYAIVDVTGY